MRKLVTNPNANVKCIQYCFENFCDPAIFFENLESLLRKDETVICMFDEKLITDQNRVIELNEII